MTKDSGEEKNPFPAIFSTSKLRLLTANTRSIITQQVLRSLDSFHLISFYFVSLSDLVAPVDKQALSNTQYS